MTTKTATILALLATVTNERMTKKSRFEALDNAEALRKTAKLSWKKIDPEFPGVEESRKSIEDFRVKDRAPATPKEGVCHYIRQELVNSDKDYGTILSEVLARWPSAKTSHKSIASLARDLRATGVEVKSRRQVKKVEETQPSKEAEAQVAETERTEEQAAA